jgi:hypothetical protein
MMNTTTKTARRTRSLVTVAAAVVLLPGLLAACSSGSPTTEETSGAKSGSGSSLASCMRDKGYDMEDPSSGSRVQTLSAPDGVDKEQWQQDLNTCLSDEGGAGEGGFKAAAPAGSDEQMRKMAQCIRDGGFSDFPDGEDAIGAYKPDDESAFDDVTSKCGEKIFGKGGTVVEQ